MNKKIYIFGLLIILLISLTSCDILIDRIKQETNNNITNKIVEVEDFTINDFQTALQIAIEKAESSVVSIVHTEGGWLGSSSLGSGVVVKRRAILKDEAKGEVSGNILEYEYYAITNRHVVMTTKKTVSTSLKVYFGDGDQVVNTKCEKYSSKADLAIIYFTTTTYIPVASLGDSTNLKKGTFVVAVGSPRSLEYYGSATFGIVSYPLRYLEDNVFVLGKNSTEKVTNVYIQHDAAINSGNSGGGLFDIEGKLIGINAQKIKSETDNIYENMGFSIPINVVKELFQEYLK